MDRLIALLMAADAGRSAEFHTILDCFDYRVAKIGLLGAAKTYIDANLSDIGVVIYDDTPPFAVSSMVPVPCSEDLEAYLAKTTFPQTVEVFANTFSGNDIANNESVRYHTDTSPAYIFPKLQLQLQNRLSETKNHGGF